MKKGQNVRPIGTYTIGQVAEMKFITIGGKRSSYVRVKFDDGEKWMEREKLTTDMKEVCHVTFKNVKSGNTLHLHAEMDIANDCETQFTVTSNNEGNLKQDMKGLEGFLCINMIERLAK